ncbi:MAG TPA: UMP kinase [Patescibacteria group bacterium]|jgi:uridylate kinase|nr:UMP kinase [Patescibacteria group bacterium]
MKQLAYSRILLKLSGEQLAGDYDGGLDPKLIVWIANEIKAAVSAGAEVVVMVGGGNYIRGAQIAGHGITRVTGDFMGMLGTMINGLAVADVFNSSGLESRVLTSVQVDQMADYFTQRRAFNHLKKGRVVIIAGGTGRPYLTTDTAAVNLALELDCQGVFKVTKVDGVYDKDPAKHKDTKHLAHISFQQALEDPNIKVMDKAAIGLAMEHAMPVVVFDLHREDNIRRAVLGESIGTIIS